MDLQAWQRQGPDCMPLLMASTSAVPFARGILDSPEGYDMPRHATAFNLPQALTFRVAHASIQISLARLQACPATWRAHAGACVAHLSQLGFKLMMVIPRSTGTVEACHASRASAPRSTSGGGEARPAGPR